MAAGVDPTGEGTSGLRTLSALAKMVFILALVPAGVIWGTSLLDLLKSRSPTCHGVPFLAPYRTHGFFSLFIGPAVLVALAGFWGWRGTKFLAALHERLRTPQYERTQSYIGRFIVVAYSTLIAAIWSLGALALTCVSR